MAGSINMQLCKNKNSSTSFDGITKIYAITDTHQETRKTCKFLSKILQDTKQDKNVLLLNCGDIFKGIYPKELEKDSYIKMKEAKPDIEMVMTLGNNDFGFNKESLTFLIDTVKDFAKKGIHTVCANIFDSTGKRPDWIRPYTIINRDGDKNLVTGFCIDNINTSKYGIIPKKQQEVLTEITNAIKNEKPDNVIILNHDYMPSSQEIVNTCKADGINVDLVVGGHDHEFIQPDKERKIFYPHAFGDTMYKMNIVNDGNIKQLKDAELITNDNIKLNPLFEKDIEKFEDESHLMEKIAPSTLNLTKEYSNPSPLGSFLADNMKSVAKSDIAFFSTGFLMKPLEYKPESYITNYNLKKAIIAETPIKTVELNNSQIKEVFDHALKSRGYGVSNPRFLQSSNNVKIIGEDNSKAKEFVIKQIYINNKPILDSNANPIKSNKKYKCAIDSYIADGGQGYTLLQQAPQKVVIKDGTDVKINEVLVKALKEASVKYKAGESYPNFEIISQ
ncbi:bifunctional metallophosphatase/5'-nucleotidase [bacterium]|nr:bifunctional metallophosphatase/5'-nucleotidase [bacterium]